MAVQTDMGKKIFFLYPHSVIQDELLDTLIMNEYETYVIKDHERALRILKRFPGSIMFINIDERLKEKAWEAYVRGLQLAPGTAKSKIGILSYNTDRVLMQKYLVELSVPCGYLQLKLGVKESTRIILEALKMNEAKGRRKYIRAPCGEDNQATLNYQTDTGILNANIIDISSAGAAVMSPDFSVFKMNTVLRRIQLKLHGALILVDAVLMGKRDGLLDSWVMLFDPQMDSDTRTQIQRFIKQSLQHYIEKLVA
jgi:hypothetical protein